MGQLGGFAVSLNYYNSGSFDVRDDSGNLTGIETAAGYGMSFGWGKLWQNNVSAGIALKAQRETLAAVDYNELALDLGLQWALTPSFNIGLTYSNLGNVIDNFAPASGVRLGCSWNTASIYNSKMILAAAMEIQPNGTTRMSMGIEDGFSNVLFARLGYVANLTNQELDGITGITAGLGVKIQDVTFDLAYIPYGSLGANYRISFTYITDFLPVSAKP
jgi:hypothetical protein